MLSCGQPPDAGNGPDRPRGRCERFPPSASTAANCRPASHWPLRHAGIAARNGFNNLGALVHPHLAWLGDIMVTPAWLPFRNMISVGDIVLVFGAVMLVMAASRTPALVRSG